MNMMKRLIGLILIVRVTNAKATFGENLVEEKADDFWENVKQDIKKASGIILKNRQDTGNEAAATNTIIQSNETYDTPGNFKQQRDKKNYDGFELSRNVPYANVRNAACKQDNTDDYYTEKHNNSKHSMVVNGDKVYQGVAKEKYYNNNDSSYEKAAKSENRMEYGKHKNQSQTSHSVEKTSATKDDDPYVAPAAKREEGDPREIFTVPCMAGMGRAADGNCVKSMGN